MILQNFDFYYKSARIFSQSIYKCSSKKKTFIYKNGNLETWQHRGGSGEIMAKHEKTRRLHTTHHPLHTPLLTLFQPTQTTYYPLDSQSPLVTRYSHHSPHERLSEFVVTHSHHSVTSIYLCAPILLTWRANILTRPYIDVTRYNIVTCERL